MLSKHSKSWKILFFILLYLTKDLAQDLTTESVKDITTESAKDLTTDSVNNLSEDSSQDVPKESAQDEPAQNDFAQDITTESVKDITRKSIEDVHKGFNQDLPEDSAQGITTKSTEDSITASAPRDKCHELSDAYIAINHDPLSHLYYKINSIGGDQKINVCSFALFFNEIIDRYSKQCLNGSKSGLPNIDENCKDVEVGKEAIPCLTFGYEFYKLCDKNFGYLDDIVRIDRNYFYSKTALCCNKGKYIHCRMNQVNLICENRKYMVNYAKNLTETYDKIQNSDCSNIQCSDTKPQKFSKDEAQNFASVNAPCICVFVCLCMSVFMRLNQLIFFWC